MSAAVRPVQEITLTGPQWDVFSNTARYRVLVAGRRFGKTYLSCAELARAAMERKNAVCWYVAPTYRMAKELAWDQLKATIPKAHLVRAPNETELSVRLINGSKIALKGADNPDSLRGLGLNLVILDEFAMLDKKVWEMVLEPALSDRQGRAFFVGTPMGYNWAYDLFLDAKTKPNWKGWQYTTLQGGNVLPEEVDAKRSSMDPRAFRQEFEASFETLQGRVYDNFDRREAPAGNVQNVEDLKADILVGMDFNVNPMSAVIGVKAGDELHIMESIEVQTSNTEEMAAELKRRYPGRKFIVCPDPSANQRRTSAAAGVTDITILQKAGFWVDASPSAIGIQDRINAVQTLLLDAKGRRRLKVHPKCKPLIKALDGLTYKEGTSIPDKNGLDHMADALGYLVWQRFNLLVSRATVTREVQI